MFDRRPRTIIRRCGNPSAYRRLEGRFHPLLARVLSNRQISSPDEVDYSLSRLHHPGSMGGIEGAVDVLSEALAGESTIVVVGDYDVDGAAGCALGVLALNDLGARHVKYFVPNRFEQGYGLSRQAVAGLLPMSPKVVVTVDNGISSSDGIAFAREQGIAVVVTDHHLPPDQLPLADAIINPNLPEDPFPSKHLCGVGVMFYLVLALRTRLRAMNWFRTRAEGEPNLARYLDLVALGTVADMVTMDANNQILVAQGLSRINQGRCRPGIRALLAKGQRRIGQIVPSDLGFAVAPRLNAAGRLDDISIGVECLLTENANHASALADTLDAINSRRREIEAEMQKQAMEAIFDSGPDARRPDPDALCLYDESWHEGVVGLVASRVREAIDLPVIAFAPGKNGELKGSARSITGVHVRDVLQGIAARQPGLMIRFGGHAMAAGVSIRPENIGAFRSEFEKEVSRVVGAESGGGQVFSDGELDSSFVNNETADLLRTGAPWGKGFPEPVFDGEFRVASHRIVGDRHLMLKLREPGGSRLYDAIAFRFGGTGDSPAVPDRVRVVYRLECNEFGGERRPRFIVEYLGSASDTPVVMAS